MAMRALGGLAIQTIKAIGAFATRAITADVPDNAVAGGNARGANAVDLQTARVAATQVASGIGTTIVGGANNTVSGQYSVAGGFDNVVSGGFSVGFGREVNTQSRVSVFQYSSGLVSTTGDRQVLIAGVWRGTTTDAATGVRLTANGSAASATNIINLVSNSSMRLRILLLAQVSGVSAKSWEIDVLIRRGAGVGTTALPTAASIASAFGDAGLATAAVAVTADTTNGGLNITVNGVAATTINWLAFLQGVEVVG